MMALKPKMEILRITDTDITLGVGFEMDRKPGDSPLDALAQLGDVSKLIGSIEMKRYIMDKEGVPVPAGVMSEAKWDDYMRRFSRVRVTFFGKFAVITVFLGVEVTMKDEKPSNVVRLVGKDEKAGELPQLFATIIVKGNKHSGDKRATTLEDAAKLHRGALNVIRANYTRMPWQVAIDYYRNGWELV